MIQPATLTPESNRGQKNTTYFSRDTLQLVLMLQLRMRMMKILFWFLKFTSSTDFHNTNRSMKIMYSTYFTDLFTYNTEINLYSLYSHTHSHVSSRIDQLRSYWTVHRSPFTLSLFAGKLLLIIPRHNLIFFPYKGTTTTNSLLSPS
jgi:hypothetical protein